MREGKVGNINENVENFIEISMAVNYEHKLYAKQSTAL